MYLERYISTGKQRVIGTEREVFALRKDGSLFPMELSVSEVNVEGKRSFAGTIRDVSNRRKDEASLCLLDSIISSPNEAIFVRGIQGNVLQWNKGAELLYGYTAQEIIGRSANIIVPTKKISEYEDSIQHVIDGKEMQHLELNLLHKNGQKINVALAFSPVRDIKGQIAGIVVNSQDISRLKEVEQNLQRAKSYADKLIETANAMIILLDRNGNIELFNTAAEKITEYSSKEILGKNFFDLLIPEEQRSSMHKLHLQNISGYLHEEIEFPIITKTAKKRIITWRKSLFHRDHTVVGVLSFGIDVTEQRQQQELLRQAHSELEIRVKERTAELHLSNQILEKEIEDRQRAEETIASSLREKEVFLKEIHHRVKNNLQLVISILNLHIHDIDNEKSVDILSDIRDRMFAIAHLHETLYLSGNLVQVNIEEYLRGLVSNLIHSASEIAEVDVVFNVESVALNIDETLRCGLIVNELVLNSLKHAFFGRHKGLITISLSQKNKTSPLLISVLDDGIGLPQKSQFEKSRSIGFHLVEKLTEKLGGEVRYSNIPGACIEVSFIPEEH